MLYLTYGVYVRDLFAIYTVPVGYNGLDEFCHNVLFTYLLRTDLESRGYVSAALVSSYCDWRAT
jgi:hypothetical protein